MVVCECVTLRHSVSGTVAVCSIALDWLICSAPLSPCLTDYSRVRPPVTLSLQPPALPLPEPEPEPGLAAPATGLTAPQHRLLLPPSPLPPPQLGGPRSAVQCGHISARSRHCRPAALYDSSASLSAEWRHNLALPGSGAASHSHRSIDWLTDWLTDWYRFLITGWGSDRSQAAQLPWRSNLLPPCFPPFLPPSHTCVTLPQLATHLLHRYIGTFLQKIILF